jgi:type I restriction enzyme, S subunit
VSQLPEGWVYASLDELCIWGSGGTPSRSIPAYFDGGIPWVTISDLNDNTVTQTAKTISHAGLENSSAKMVPAGAIMVVLYGSIGKLGIAGLPLTTNQAIAYSIPNNYAYNAHYLFHFLNGHREQLNKLGSGVTQKNIYLGNLRLFKIPIAPRLEQTRIAEKLEELLSDLDAGVAELKAAQKKLVQYRQSLLKAAVEGALTAEWRKTHQPEETGAQLLVRILKERRSRWDAKQLAKYQEQGKTPPKDWQDKYPAPVKHYTSNLPDLPEGWVWASIEQIVSDEPYSLAIGPFGSNLKVSDYRVSGVPLVFIRNIRSGFYGGTHTKFVSPEKAKELKAHSIQSGDVLITKMGEPPGDADVYPQDQPYAIITADCIKVRCRPNLLDASLLASVINSHIGKSQILPITQGVAQKKMSLGRFSSLVIPLPSVLEQNEITANLSTILQEVLFQEEAINISLKQSAAQRKNILKAAFSGQLVPQDPNDEPASVLLERIRNERKTQISKGSTRTRKLDNA